MYENPGGATAPAAEAHNVNLLLNCLQFVHFVEFVITKDHITIMTVVEDALNIE